MSKNSKNSRRSKLGAAAGNDQITVVDGNAVGVAPNGDAAATETNDDAAVAAVLEAADPAPAADEIDPEILALLGDESAELPVEPVADPEPVAADAVDAGEEMVVENADTDVEVQIEAHDEEEILSQLEGDENAPAADASADPAATTTTRKKREPKAAAPTRVFTDVAAIDPAAFKTNLDGSTAKKVNEKVSNLQGAIERGIKLSRYTQLAVKTLVADGKVSGKSIREMFEANGLSKGTAAAQSQQMTALFKIVGLATPDATNARELVLADRGLADELMQLAA
jgi:hypothetical protein